MMRPESRVLVDARIVHDAMTGAGRYVTRLLEELQALEEPDVRSIALTRAGQRLPAGVPVSQLPGLGGQTSPLGLAQQVLLPLALWRQPFDLYHYPYFDLPSVLGRRPVVATCYDLEPLRHPELFSSKVVWFYRLFSRRLRRADRIVTISRATAADVCDLLGISEGRVVAISLGVDAHFGRVSLAGVTSVRQRYGLANPFVLYVGNTMPHKNLPRLIEALALVRRHVSGVDLVLAGAPDRYRGTVEEAIRAAGLDGIARFIGKVPEVQLPALMSAASVFAFPSLYEGFGLPVLEAMACGVPVVTSNRASLPEVVGDAALQVDPLSVTALADAIVHVLEDAREAQRMSAAGLARAKQFTWRRCAQAHADVYREVLNR